MNKKFFSLSIVICPNDSTVEGRRWGWWMGRKVIIFPAALEAIRIYRDNLQLTDLTTSTTSLKSQFSGRTDPPIVTTDSGKENKKIK